MVHCYGAALHALHLYLYLYLYLSNYGGVGGESDIPFHAATIWRSHLGFAPLDGGARRNAGRTQRNKRLDFCSQAMAK